MTPEAQLALINSLPTIIASIGTVLMAIVAYRIQQGKVDDNDAQVEVGKKLDVIHELTNSNLTDLKNQIQTQELLIREMLTQQAAEAKAQVAPAAPSTGLGK